MSLFTGSGVALVTPFTDDDHVNFDKLAELINWHIAEGTDAIVVCGTTGEASTLTDEEHKEVIQHAVEVVNKRIPVIAGTGSNETSYAIQLSQYAEKVGADGLLCVTPYYNKTTQKGLVVSFTAIADAVSIPIILYNVPSRTGLNMQPATVAKLAEHKNIQGVKEASGDITQVAEIARLVPTDFDIYSGEDAIVVPLLSLGGKGVISTVANILPKDMHTVNQLWFEGKIKEACQLQLKMKPVIDGVFLEVNPIPIKTALNLLGCKVGKPRLPLVEMDEKNVQNLQQRMRDYGVLK